MSVRQGAELDHAFERNGWTADDIKWLSKGDTLSTILGIRNGTAKVVPVEAPKPPISKPFLIPRGTVAVPPVAEPFMARAHFVRNTNKDASVKISSLGSNFTDWFIDKTENAFSGSKLQYADLDRSSVDGLIITELGGEEQAETTLVEVFALMATQPNGEGGSLLVADFRANIFYVRDATGVLRAVRVAWYGGGWHVYASAVTSPIAWLAGYRVFSHNSR
jgi:hypothetical protein